MKSHIVVSAGQDVVGSLASSLLHKQIDKGLVTIYDEQRQKL
jgi:hypothetical protein